MRRTLLLVCAVIVALVATGVAVAKGAPLPPFETNAECMECHSVGAPR